MARLRRDQPVRCFREQTVDRLEVLPRHGRIQRTRQRRRNQAGATALRSPDGQHGRSGHPHAAAHRQHTAIGPLVAAQRAGEEAGPDHFPVHDGLARGILVKQGGIDPDLRHLDRPGKLRRPMDEQPRLHSREGDGILRPDRILIVDPRVGTEPAGDIQGDNGRVALVRQPEHRAQRVGQTPVEPNAVDRVHQHLRLPHRRHRHIRLGFEIALGGADPDRAGIHVRRIRRSRLAAEEDDRHLRARLHQLAGHDKAVAAVVAFAAQDRHLPAPDLIARADHPAGRAAGVFHQARIIEAARHRRRFHQPHIPGCQNLHDSSVLSVCRSIAGNPRGTLPPCPDAGSRLPAADEKRAGPRAAKRPLGSAPSVPSVYCCVSFRLTSSISSLGREALKASMTRSSGWNSTRVLPLFLLW